MKKKLVTVFNIILLMYLSCNSVFATTIDDIRNKIYGAGNDTAAGIFNAGAFIAGWITYAAEIVCVIMLMYLGIKFIVSAPEGKADVKKQLVPIAVGLGILVLMSAVFNWIQSIADSYINTL